MESGFSLIEIMVTMFVMSVGLLGLAKMESFSMRMNHSAYLRTQGALLAQNMIARIRANQAGVKSLAYNGLANPARIANCLSKTGCNGTEMAQNDAFDWQILLPAILPSGQGTICIDSTPADGADASNAACDGVGSLYAAKLWWNDARDGSGALHRFVTSFSP